MLIQKLRGQGAALPARPPLRAIALAWLGGALAIATVALAGQQWALSLILGSFGAGGLGRVFLTSWLALRGRVEAIVPLSRPNFIVQESQNGVTTGQFSVFKPPTIGAAGYFGAEVLFL